MITDVRVDDADLLARDPERSLVTDRQRELSRQWYLANAERKKATQKAQYRRLCEEAKAAGMKTYVYRKMKR
tara:strand:- start:448 stop:663 length:216 start_codon:yes stop_codon:yes gene_type:complete